MKQFTTAQLYSQIENLENQIATSKDERLKIHWLREIELIKNKIAV